MHTILGLQGQERENRRQRKARLGLKSHNIYEVNGDINFCLLFCWIITERAVFILYLYLLQMSSEGKILIHWNKGNDTGF